MIFRTFSAMDRDGIELEALVPPAYAVLTVPLRVPSHFWKRHSYPVSSIFPITARLRHLLTFVINGQSRLVVAWIRRELTIAARYVRRRLFRPRRYRVVFDRFMMPRVTSPYPQKRPD